MGIGLRRTVAVWWLAAAGCLVSTSASAIRLDIVPDFTRTFVGNNFSVDVVVSGLDAAGEIVSTFDLDVTYDPSILTALGVAYGTGLGGGTGDSFQFTPSFGGGLIDFAESSFLLDVDLDALQGDSVTLASLSFQAIGVGISSLQFVQDALFFLTGRFDTAGIPADLNPDVGGGRVQVDPRQVDPRQLPVPGALALFLLGLAALGYSQLRPARSAIL